MSEINENVMPEEEEEGVVVLTDEDGNEIRFEIVAQTEHKGNTYFAMVPIDDQNEESEVEEYVILKLEEHDGEEFFVTIDDEEEYDDVTDVFDDLFSQEIFYEDDPEGK